MQNKRRDPLPFDYHDPVVLEVAPGGSFQVETDDALTGVIDDDSDTPTVHRMVNDPHMTKLRVATEFQSRGVGR